MLGLLHAAFSVLALALGGAVLLAPKGTHAHVRVGAAYVAAMVALNLSALGIYHLTGRFNFFHALAILSLAMVLGGYYQAATRRSPKWLWRHYQYMCWSYVGIIAAANNEAFVRVPALTRLARHTTTALPLLGSVVVVALGGVLIFGRQKALLARFADRLGPPRRRGTTGTPDANS
jgi:uncharacterized membrane protein